MAATHESSVSGTRFAGARDLSRPRYTHGAIASHGSIASDDTQGPRRFVPAAASAAHSGASTFRVYRRIAPTCLMPMPATPIVGLQLQMSLGVVWAAA